MTSVSYLLFTVSSFSLTFFFKTSFVLADFFPTLQKQDKIRNVTKSLGNFFSLLGIFPCVLC